MPKRLFWSYGKKLLGSGIEWLKGNEVDGIIFLSSFGCGIDSFVEELIRRFNARKHRLPYAVFTVDEHSGQGGFDTRLEAFIDMLEWRDKSGYNLSSHGQDVYSG
jgi:predicted nucleotide-binding protein (sugar kinase/HSP70/actin superfamily)